MLNSFLIVLQDMLVPLTELRSAIEMLDRELELYPVWLCPFKLFAQVILRVWSDITGVISDIRGGHAEICL